MNEFITKIINGLRTRFYQWRYRRAMKRLNNEMNHLKRELGESLIDVLKDIIGTGE